MPGSTAATPCETSRAIGSTDLVSAKVRSATISAAQKAGKFAAEIIAVEVRGKKGIEPFAADEAPRPDTTAEALAKLRPAFREGGTITAGNAPGLNVEGGAIAHGHPIGATGAVLTTRLIHSMRRDRLKRGIVTLCIGGGQGIALAIETLA